jgi:hypothetical protein
MRRGIVTVLVMLGLQALAAPAALAGNAVGSFEIDGNLADDSGPGEPIDWATPPPNLVTFTDATGKSDEMFKQGSKELEPARWVCARQKVPAKDDILSGALSFRRFDTGAGKKQFAYLDFFRASPEGDAHMDYELNQSTEPNPACPALPKRTAGDLLITFDTELGGKQIIVRLFRWQGDHLSGTFQEVPTGMRGVTWDGAVNIPGQGPHRDAAGNRLLPEPRPNQAGGQDRARQG